LYGVHTHSLKRNVRCSRILARWLMMDRRWSDGWDQFYKSPAGPKNLRKFSILKFWT
jgi:hypothetical protein